MVYEGYDDEQGNNTKNSYSYNKNGQLLTSTVDCNYTLWEYSYEYDKQDRLVKKIKNNELEVSYEYFQNRLIKEIRFSRNGNIETIYEYDDSGLLIYKKENDNIVEKNINVDGRLIERWTYYFGIDPSYYPCGSQ